MIIISRTIVPVFRSSMRHQDDAPTLKSSWSPGASII